MKNKFLCIVLAAAMVCSMAGCSKDSGKDRRDRDRDEIEEDEDEREERDDRDEDDEDEDDEDERDTEVMGGPPEVTHNIHGWDEETTVGSDADSGIVSGFYFGDYNDPTPNTYNTFAMNMPNYYMVDGREVWISSSEAGPRNNGVYTGFDYNWEDSEGGYESDIMLYLDMIGSADSMTVEMAVRNAEAEDPAWKYTQDRNWWSALGTASSMDGMNKEYETERLYFEFEGFIFYGELQYRGDTYCTKEDAEKYLVCTLENLVIYPDTAQDIFGV